MDLFHVIGDALWIVALSIMCSLSLGAYRRIPKGVKVPMQWARNGRVVWRAGRLLGLFMIPAVSLFIGILLVVMNRDAKAAPSDALILFGVRAVIPGILAVLHLRWLQAALKALEEDGAIEP